MGRVGRALVWHELLERTRDRWVLVISLLFALLATGVGLYGRSAEADVAKLTGPSLVTLASLLVPLVALVLSHDAIVGERERNTLGLLLSLPVGRFEVVAAKLVGRSLALAIANTTTVLALIGEEGTTWGHVVLGFLLVHSLSEAGQFADEGFQSIICGPGSIAQAHRANEFIAKEQLDKGVVMIDKLIEELSSDHFV